MTPKEYIKNLPIDINFVKLSNAPSKKVNYELYQNNPKLLTIYEDEWRDRSTQIKDIIQNILGNTPRGLPARKLTVGMVSPPEAKLFFNRYHIQGTAACNYYIGGFDKTKLVGVMGFGAPTRQNTKNICELKRFAIDGQTHAGLASKLFSYFMKNIKTDDMHLLSYSDNRYFSGNLYPILGFKYDGDVVPDYQYTDGTRRWHKGNFRKSKIKERFPEIYNEQLTEREMMEQTSISRIWDCGKKRWIC